MTPFTQSAAPSNFVTVDKNHEILNYPYAYDQDPQEECDFQEKLYRASKAQSEKLLDWRKENLYPTVPEAFHGAKDFS